jgi:hypothetical protein
MSTLQYAWRTCAVALPFACQQATERLLTLTPVALLLLLLDVLMQGDHAPIHQKYLGQTAAKQSLCAPPAGHTGAAKSHMILQMERIHNLPATCRIAHCS